MAKNGGPTTSSHINRLREHDSKIKGVVNGTRGQRGRGGGGGEEREPQAELSIC